MPKASGGVWKSASLVMAPRHCIYTYICVCGASTPDYNLHIRGDQCVYNMFEVTKLPPKYAVSQQLGLKLLILRHADLYISSIRRYGSLVHTSSIVLVKGEVYVCHVRVSGYTITCHVKLFWRVHFQTPL